MWPLSWRRSGFGGEAYFTTAQTATSTLIIQVEKYARVLVGHFANTNTLQYIHACAARHRCRHVPTHVIDITQYVFVHR